MFPRSCALALQVFLASLDQQLHTLSSTASPTPIDTDVILTSLHTDVLMIPKTADTNFSASFGHLAGGYDSAYYGYLWSEVYSAGERGEVIFTKWFGWWKHHCVGANCVSLTYRLTNLPVIGYATTPTHPRKISHFLGRHVRHGVRGQPPEQRGRPQVQVREEGGGWIFNIRAMKKYFWGFSI